MNGPEAIATVSAPCAGADAGERAAGGGAAAITRFATRQCPLGFWPCTHTTCPGKSEKRGTSRSSRRTRMPLEVAIEPSSCTDCSFRRPSLSHTTRPTTVTSSCDAAYTAPRQFRPGYAASHASANEPSLRSSISALSATRSRMHRASRRRIEPARSGAKTRTLTAGACLPARAPEPATGAGKEPPSSVLASPRRSRLANAEVPGAGRIASSAAAASRAGSCTPAVAPRPCARACAARAPAVFAPGVSPFLPGVTAASDASTAASAISTSSAPDSRLSARLLLP